MHQSAARRSTSQRHARKRRMHQPRVRVSGVSAMCTRCVTGSNNSTYNGNRAENRCRPFEMQPEQRPTSTLIRNSEESGHLRSAAWVRCSVFLARSTAGLTAYVSLRPSVRFTASSRTVARPDGRNRGEILSFFGKQRPGVKTNKPDRRYERCSFLTDSSPPACDPSSHQR